MTAVIATSPLNGYYTVANMTKMFAWAANNFDDFSVFVMDGASIHNLIALGYSPAAALTKTKKEDRNLRNKIRSSLSNANLSNKNILLLSDTTANIIYKKYFDVYVERYNTDIAFQTDCRNATRQILTNKMTNVTDPAVDVAVNYILAEMPIWCNLPQILNAPHVTLVYKDISPFWQKICACGLVDKNQRILIIDKF